MHTAGFFDSSNRTTQWFSSTILCGFVFAAWHSTVVAADQFNDLVLRIPPSANTIVLLDIEGLFKSPLGIEQAWAKRYKTDYSGGLVPFPPSVQVSALAALIDPETMRIGWEFGIVKLKQPFSMTDLARRELTNVEKLDGHSIVTSSRRTYYLELVPQTIAVTTHQNRQDMARWLKFAKSNKQVAVSDYLRSAVQQAAGKDLYLLAVDLQDSLHQEEVRLRLEHSQALADQKVDLDALTKIVTSVRGLRVNVQVSKTINATVRVDFAADLTPFAKVMPRLVLNSLERMGADIEELHQAEAKVEGNSVVIEHSLSEPSLRRLISLIRPQAGSLETDEPPVPGAVADANRLAASQRFYKAVNTLLNDLEKHARKSKNYATSAHWFDTYAKQVDQLPTRDVDADLLAYAGSVSSKLRAVAGSLRGVPLDVKSLEYEKKEEFYAYPAMVSVTPYVTTGGAVGWNYNVPPNWVDYKNNFAEVQAKQAKVIAEGEKDRDRIWQLLTDETASMRSKMSRKYKTQF
ncbi:MAG: hypothetical protein HZA46_21990 [Planctomycetales bacterium]|nr:hypothetical protein [Planctomycetales bacterium]